MIPTPTTSHLSAKDFESVYEPAGEYNVLSVDTELELDLMCTRGYFCAAGRA